MKRKILFVLPTLDAGGAENYALRFINYYQHKFEFHVLSVKPGPGDLNQEFLKKGAKVYYQSIGYFNPVGWYSFFDLLRKHRFDSICTFTGNFGGVPLTLARTAGIKNRIAFYRRSTIAFRPNPMKLIYNKFINYLVRKSATRILSNSEYAFKNFFGDYFRKDERFSVIPNGVDAKLFDVNISKSKAREIIGIEQDAFIVGHVGRYDPAKNHETIFKVAQHLTKSEPDVKFVFCGKGTDSREFLDRIKKYDIEKNTVCLGLQDNLPIVYKSFDVFYFPSVTEGQPNALIEAMMAGIPVLASNIKPINNMFPKQEKPWLVPPLETDKVVNIIKKIKSNVETIRVNKKMIKQKFALSKNMNSFKRELIVE